MKHKIGSLLILTMIIAGWLYSGLKLVDSRQEVVGIIKNPAEAGF